MRVLVGGRVSGGFGILGTGAAASGEGAGSVGLLLGRWEVGLEGGGGSFSGTGSSSNAVGFVRGSVFGGHRLQLTDRVAFPIRVRLGFNHFTDVDTGRTTGLMPGFSLGIVFLVGRYLELGVDVPEVTFVASGDRGAAIVAASFRVNLRL